MIRTGNTVFVAVEAALVGKLAEKGKARQLDFEQALAQAIREFVGQEEVLGVDDDFRVWDTAGNLVATFSLSGELMGDG